MRSMLEFLFSSEITFPGSWAEERCLGGTLDEMLDLEGRIRTQLGEEQADLWNAYQKKVRQLENQRYQAEFDRGVLTAANLALEIFRRTAERTD